MSEVYFFDALSGTRVVMNADFGRASRLRSEVAQPVPSPWTWIGVDWGKAMPSDNAPEPELPEGVSESGGRYFADCCRCERECDVTEFMDEAADIDFTQWFGGCSPGCCP